MRQQIGMTFLELILVMAILGILASIAVPNFSGAFDAVDDKKVADKLMADLRQARSMAQACAGGTVVVEIRGDGWDIEPDNCNYETINRDTSGIDTQTTFSFSFDYPNGNVAEEQNITIGSITVTVMPSGEIKR